MPKTIAVVDEQGRTYEATYPKRARGLVKKGRARFVSESMICLARPPRTEDKRMSNIVTIEQIFEQINKIVENGAFFERTLHSLTTMTTTEIPTDSYAPGDIAGQARAQAVADICRCRETTNQQLIRLYEKMYDDMMTMQGLQRDNRVVIHTDTVKGVLTIPETPDIPPVPDLPDMPDIPMIPPV